MHYVIRELERNCIHTDLDQFKISN